MWLLFKRVRTHQPRKYKLTKRLLEELAYFGSSGHPIAHTIPYIVKESRKSTMQLMAVACLVSLGVGFLLSFVLVWGHLDAISNKTEVWYARCIDSSRGKR